MDLLTACALVRPSRLPDGRVIARRNRERAVVLSDPAIERRIRRRSGAGLFLALALCSATWVLKPGVGAFLWYVIAAGTAGAVATLGVAWAFAGLPTIDAPAETGSSQPLSHRSIDALVLSSITAAIVGAVVAEGIRLAISPHVEPGFFAFAFAGLAVWYAGARAVLSRWPEPSAFDAA